MTFSLAQCTQTRRGGFLTVSALIFLLPLFFSSTETSAFSFSPQHDSFKTRTTTTSKSNSISRTVSSNTLSTNRSYKSSPPLFEKTLKMMGQDSNTTLNKDEDIAQESLDVHKEGAAVVEKEEMSESKKLLMQIKESGTAGVISYALWELGFWALSVPVCIYAYYKLVGHMPDFSNQEDLAKLGGEAFAFVNFARFAVPLRIGLALSTTPWIQENIVDSFLNKKDEKGE